MLTPSAVLLFLVVGVIAMIPTSILVVVVVKRLGGGLPAGLIFTTNIDALLAVGAFLVIKVVGVPYELWQLVLSFGSALVSALIWNVLGFVVFRR